MLSKLTITSPDEAGDSGAATLTETWRPGPWLRRVGATALLRDAETATGAGTAHFAARGAERAAAEAARALEASCIVSFKCKAYGSNSARQCVITLYSYPRIYRV